MLPPRKDEERALATKFEIPADVWADGPASTPILELGNLITIEMVVSDVAGLIRYSCTFNRLVGYAVTVVEPHRPL